MPKFIRNPEVVEARQLIIDEDNMTKSIDEAFILAEWCNGIFDVVDRNIMLMDLIPDLVYVENQGWIIKDSDGNFYPCSNDEFIKKYTEIKE